MTLSLTPPLPHSHHAGMVATVMLHAMLLLAWQQARKMPPLHWPEPESVQWVQVPPASPPMQRAPNGGPPGQAMPRPASTPVKPAWAPPTTPIIGTTPATPALSVEDVPEPPPDPQAAASVPPADGSTLAERARREAGAIDKVLRKENKATIVAPPDSPHIRMASKFREAAALAPNRWWEAPKVVELVNDGGDGARRVRVLTALGIYCITERSPATSIDMIEKHGKQRITNCGHEHEQPANPQEWRTARD